MLFMLLEMAYIFTHLKLWVAIARHNFRWVKIMIEAHILQCTSMIVNRLSNIDVHQIALYRQINNDFKIKTLVLKRLNVAKHSLEVIKM